MAILSPDSRFNPCPRCGQHNVSAMYFDSVADGKRKWGAECNNPSCEDIALVPCVYSSPTEAIAAWNNKYPIRRTDNLGVREIYKQARLSSDTDQVTKLHF